MSLCCPTSSRTGYGSSGIGDLPRRAARALERRLCVAGVKQLANVAWSRVPPEFVRQMSQATISLYASIVPTVLIVNSSASFHCVEPIHGLLTGGIIRRWLVGEAVVQHVPQLRGIRERRVPTGVQHLADYPARVIPAYGSAGTP